MIWCRFTNEQLVFRDPKLESETLTLLGLQAIVPGFPDRVKSHQLSAAHADLHVISSGDCLGRLVGDRGGQH